MILKENILSKITEKDIMEFYWGEQLKDNKPIYRNPMRHDNKGKCYFKWHRNKYMFVDRAKGVDANFDCFQYIMWCHSCNFYEALNIIHEDLLSNTKFNLTKPKKQRSSSPKLKNKSVNFKIKLRSWNEHDKSYWNQFEIKLNTVNKIAKPVSSYKSDSNSFVFTTKYKYVIEDPCYVYQFESKVKLYQPYSDFNKWRSNTTTNNIFGYKELPHFDDVLFIASGGKDMLCLWEMGFNAIAPQSESNKLSEAVIDDIKCRFKNIYFIYDNDPTGIEMSNKFANEYNLNNIIIPNVNDCKDIAELCKKIGLNNTKQIINNKLKK